MSYAPAVRRPSWRVAPDIYGRKVLATYARIAPVGWLVFPELPAEEANAPVK